MNWSELEKHLINDHAQQEEAIEPLDADTCRYIHRGLHSTRWRRSGAVDHDHADDDH